jgi:RND superfamily putative drug exporter
MKKVLNSDLNRMTVIVTIGILLVLIFVIRSIWEPLVITASLLGAYYASMFVLNRIYLDLKGLDGVQSFVPFFAFIVIVALGVDYSIFLMMRFKEYPHMSHMEAITLASKHIGAVVMSAAIILGGTFATLIPSGLSVLVQLAVAVITGLSVLCFILLPIFLPAMIALPNALAGLLSREKGNMVIEQK